MFKWFKKGKTSRIRTVGTQWWKFGIALALFGAGAALAYMGNEQGNPIMIAPGFLIMLGGFFLFLNAREGSSSRILPGMKKLAQPANVLILSPDEIEFDYIKKPPGHQQRCINDGKWYSVLEQKGREKPQEFKLPDDAEDERHYDPREFANPVTMPANKKLFEPRPNMVKTIAVGVMGLAVCILGIVIIAMSG